MEREAAGLDITIVAPNFSGIDFSSQFEAMRAENVTISTQDASAQPERKSFSMM